MKSIKSIQFVLYFFFIAFSICTGALMSYFGNEFSKIVMLPGIILGIYESYKSDK